MKLTTAEAIAELKKVDTIDMPARLCEAHYMAIESLRRGVIIPEGATRSEVHKLVFGFEPPELDSPYYDCANRKGGCDNCKHRDDERCNKNWWESLYEGSDAE